MKQKKENFLDYTPRKNRLYEWKENERGQVEICVLNKGIFCRITQIFLHRPKKTNIELDQFGSFVWRQLDGKKSIYEIGKALRAEFGATTEPLYERLVSFVQILHDNHFVVYDHKKNNR